MKFLLGKASAALVDQVLLSALNLAIALSFIQLAPKQEYATYLLLFAPLFLAQGIQNALLSSPFTTLHVKQEASRAHDYSKALLVGQLALGAMLFVLSFLGMLIYNAWQHVSSEWTFLMGFPLAILGVLAREGVRGFFYAKKEAHNALKGDLMYGALLIVLIYLSTLSFNGMTAKGVLISIGLAGVVASLIQLVQFRHLSSTLSCWEKSIWKEYWQYGRWALRGVLMTWLNANTYPYIVLILFSALAVADMAAARLFWMPLVLVAAAWSTIFRPYLSGWHQQQSFVQIRKVSYLSFLIGAAVFLGYLVILYFAFPTIQQTVLTEHYHGLWSLVAVWGGFFFVQFVRSVLMASLMVNEQGYKILSYVALVALVSMVLIMPLTQFFSIQIVVVALTIIEMVQILVIARYLPSYWGLRLVEERVVA